MNKRRVYSFSEIAPEADMISAEAYTLNFKICVQEYTPQAYLYTLFGKFPMQRILFWPQCILLFGDSPCGGYKSDRRIYSFSEIVPEADMISTGTYTLRLKLCAHEYTRILILYTLTKHSTAQGA